MTLREFRMADRDEVVALWQAAGLVLSHSDRPEGLRRKLARDPDLFLVAEEDGRIAGAVMGCYDGRRGWVNHLAVAPGRQGRGLGAALVARVEERLRAKGCEKVNLLIEPDNAGVQAFYARLGYATDPLIFMEKWLAPPAAEVGATAPRGGLAGAAAAAPAEARVRAQPLIAVRDVEASSRWYQELLGCRSGHGGPEYEQLVKDGQLLLQLHRWDDHEHPNLGDPDAAPHGHGVLLWFETEAFDLAVERARALGARIVHEPRVNLRARHRECWMRDPDGYTVVLASPPGDTG